MNLKGNVSTVDNVLHKAKIVFKERHNLITPEVPIAPHVGVLEIGDEVLVAFYDDNLDCGLVISKFKGAGI